MVETSKDPILNESVPGDTDTDVDAQKAAGRIKRPQLSLRPRLRSRLHRLRRSPRRARR